MNKLSVCSLEGLLLQFFDKSDDFVNKNEKFLQYYHQQRFNNNQWLVISLVFAAGVQVEYIYPESKEVLLQGALKYDLERVNENI